MGEEAKQPNHLLFLPSDTVLNNLTELSPCSDLWREKGKTDRLERYKENMVLFYVKQTYSLNSGKCSKTSMIFEDN